MHLFVHSPRGDADHEDESQGSSIFGKVSVDWVLRSSFCRVAIVGQ